ncbi:MAG: SDR family NAD(P)-dependent oxidoreductase [Pseudomonadota bacterium]
MTIDFSGSVALITGAGHGLGRSHAIELGKRGAQVIVNDLGREKNEETGETASQSVAREITEAGGKALAVDADICDDEAAIALIDRAQKDFGRLDILINNAGFLRDRSFGKMTIQEFDDIIGIHLRAPFVMTHRAWNMMRDQNYGRIVFTTSSSGLFGNFGQANYAAAKSGLVGLMNALHVEGEKYNIKVNCIAPVAMTRMLATAMPEHLGEKLKPEAVSAGVLFLVSEDAPSKTILSAAAGAYMTTKLVDTKGAFLPIAQWTPEQVARSFEEISDMTETQIFQQAGEQTFFLMQKATESA